MLIRFNVENFKSFCDNQKLVMIPAKKLKAKKDHLIRLNGLSLLRNATIYGANASGKSNIIEAISFAKYVITRKIPTDARNLYCRTDKNNRNRETKFEFEIFKNDKCYAYGFSINMDNQIIKSEWLYELLANNNDQTMLFERETDSGRLELGKEIELDSTDQMRFNTYRLDFEDNKSGLFIREMNRNKKIDKSSKLYFFSDVYSWFENDLTTIFPDQPITNFEYFYGDGGSDKINKIIDIFDTGISNVKIKEISLADFKNKLPTEIAEDIMKSFKNKLEASIEASEIKMSLRTDDAFYNIRASKSEEPVITTIMLEHNNTFSEFEFSEESDGTRRLFDLLDILISDEKNKVYVIDELERSLHPKLTYKFIELFFDLLKDNNVQLIFTTHEATIMDQELLRRDEIWFVEKNNEGKSHLYSLDRFKERYDKKLSKAYLDGRYGAIPVFKDLFGEVTD